MTSRQKEPVSPLGVSLRRLKDNVMEGELRTVVVIDVSIGRGSTELSRK